MKTTGAEAWRRSVRAAQMKRPTSSAHHRTNAAPLLGPEATAVKELGPPGSSGANGLCRWPATPVGAGSAWRAGRLRSRCAEELPGAERRSAVKVPTATATGTAAAGGPRGSGRGCAKSVMAGSSPRASSVISGACWARARAKAPGARLVCMGALNAARATMAFVAATGDGATGGAGTLAAMAGDVPDTDSGGGPAAAVGGLLDEAFAPVVLLPVAGEAAAGPPSLLGALLAAPPVALEPPGVIVLALSLVDAVEGLSPPEPVTLLAVVVAFAFPFPFPFAFPPGAAPVVVAACGGAAVAAGAGAGATGVEAAGGVAAGAGSGAGVPAAVVTADATVASAVDRTSVAVSAANALVLAAAAATNARVMAASSRRS